MLAGSTDLGPVVADMRASGYRSSFVRIFLPVFYSLAEKRLWGGGGGGGGGEGGQAIPNGSACYGIFNLMSLLVDRKLCTYVRFCTPNRTRNSFVVS